MIPERAELGHERAIVTREYLHSMIARIGNEQETSMMVERQVLRYAEHSVIISDLATTDGDLDSVIVHLTDLVVLNRYQRANEREREREREQLGVLWQRESSPITVLLYLPIDPRPTGYPVAWLLPTT